MVSDVNVSFELINARKRLGEIPLVKMFKHDYTTQVRWPTDPRVPASFSFIFQMRTAEVGMGSMPFTIPINADVFSETDPFALVDKKLPPLKPKTSSNKLLKTGPIGAVAVSLIA